MGASLESILLVSLVGVLLLGAVPMVRKWRQLKEYAALLRRMERRQQAVVKLASSQASALGDLKRVAKEITETAVAALDVDRAGIWLGGKGDGQLRCIDIFDRRQQVHSGGDEQEARPYGSYLTALAAEQVLNAADAQNDLRLSEFRSAGMLPSEVVTLLDAAVRVDGMVLGVLRVEHHCGRRVWQSDEIRFASELAGQVSNTLLSFKRRQAELVIREREKALVASEQKYRGLFREMAAGFALFKTAHNPIRSLGDCTFLEVNPAFEQLTGLLTGQVVGKTLQQVLPNTDREWSRKFGPAYSPAQLERFELYFPELERYFDISSYQPADDRLALMLMDISDRKRAEDQLRYAKELAETAVRTKSEFLAKVSHEIRTPMHGVIGMADLMRETYLDAEQQEYIDTIRNSAKVLLTIINDILDFSRIEADKLALNPKRMQFRDFIDRALKLLQTRMQSREQKFIEEIAEDIPEQIIGDEVRLGQVLINLVDNAVKFTPPGGVIRLSVRNDSSVPEPEAGKTALHFSVSDSGIGIPADQLEKIFEPFTQVDGSTTRQFGGAGPGLTICKRLVELMGGRLWVESREKAGTTFHFRIVFELGESAQAAAPNQAAAGAGAAAVSSAACPLRILVVEDNEINRKVIQTFLERLGCKVIVADNGQEALNLLGSPEPPLLDLIIMDCQMPVLDGFETTARIRQREQVQGGHIPIIALTAYALDGDRERCLAAGMDDYLAKPYDRVQFLELLLKWVEKREQ